MFGIRRLEGWFNYRFDRLEKKMSELLDAVAGVETSLSAELAAVQAALSKPNPDVADAVARLGAVKAQLDAQTAALTPAA